MKKTLLSLILISSCYMANAQLILNGDFEISSDSCQINLLNHVANSFLQNFFAFGKSSEIDIMDSSCGYGGAKSGNWFIGIAVSPYGYASDAFSLKLTSPLTVGHQYQVSFYARKYRDYATNPVIIGVSNKPSSFGDTLYTSSLSDTIWALNTFSFTNTAAFTYLTVSMSGDTNSWTHLDNFALTDLTGINQLSVNSNQLSAYPNPASTQFTINSTQAFTAIELVNILGQTVYKSTPERAVKKATISVTFLPNGIYVLRANAGDTWQQKEVVIGR